MVYDKSYYELLLLIENKIQSIESKSQEVALPDNLRVQLENIKQAADSAYQEIEKLSLADLTSFYNDNLKPLKYNTAIIGKKENLDLIAMKKMGKFYEVSLEEIFGY